MKNISIFLPRDTPWYQGLILQISRGFNELNFNVSHHCGLLNEEQLLRWVKNHTPDVIFEMNRPRNDIPYLPKDIIHICWVVDFNGRNFSDFNGSEITYLFSPRWIEKSQNTANITKWLGPGACPEDYYKIDNFPYQCEASFIGHIPNPWSTDELNRSLSKQQTSITFGKLIPFLMAALKKNKYQLKIHDDYINLAQELCKKHFNNTAEFDKTLEYDISGRLIRLINRMDLIDKLLFHIDDLFLYGPDNWKRWEHLEAHYKGFLNTPSKINKIYNSTQINFHEGNGIHFRVMDCMSAGGLLFAKKTDYDEKLGGIKTFFSPDKHYVEFELDNVHEKINFYLDNPDKANAIRYNAFSEIRNKHTWKHRADSIINDLKQL